MPAVTLHWTPGGGGLLARVPSTALPSLDDRELPAEAIALADEDLHITLLRSAAMQPLIAWFGDDPRSLLDTLPDVPFPVVEPGLHVATRPPHPVKDAPDEQRPRITWFHRLADQPAWTRALDAIVVAIDRALRSRGGPGFEHPEPTRLFHVSRLNNRGGASARSIGSIRLEDLS